MFRDFVASVPLRVKLVVGCLFVTAVSLGVALFFSHRSTRKELSMQVAANLDSQADAHALAIGGLLARQVDTLRALAVSRGVRDAVAAANATYPADTGGNAGRAEALDAKWIAADERDELLADRLGNPLANELIAFRTAFPDHVEVFATDRWGGLAASTNRTSDYYQADEPWWQAAWSEGRGGVFIGQPEYDESARSFSINFAVPVRAWDKPLAPPIGVLRSTYRIDNTLGRYVSDVSIEQGGLDLFVSENEYLQETTLAEMDGGALAQLIGRGSGRGQVDYDGVTSLASASRVRTVERDTAISALGWTAVIHQREEEALRPLDISDQAAILLSVVALVLAGLLALGLQRVISSPIRRLTDTAKRIADGELADFSDPGPAGVVHDELGELASAVQTMRENLSSVIGQVQASGLQVTSSAAEIAANGKQLEATVTEQVASTKEVVATTREIAATADELARTVTEVASATEETAAAASGGHQDLVAMEASMAALVNATDEISSRLGAISEKAQAISGIVTTITNVVDQTNLLSLNAAIESEKAGEHGRGFSVVATEIRRLADQTAVAALDIEQMVKEMQTAVTRGVMETEKFSETVAHSVEEARRISAQIAGVIERVQGVVPSFEVVNTGMQGQSLGAMQIREAMEQLSQTWSQTADAVRHTNGALEQLNEAAHNLQREVTRFRF
jgi:methyl-accepting chemotaxis protein